MRGIRSTVNTFLSTSDHPVKATVRDIRLDDGAEASGFPTLVARVAAIAYHNPEFTLLFRGQGEDYVNSNGASVMYPALLRPSDSPRLSTKEIASRLRHLRQFEEELVKVFGDEIDTRMRRQDLLRWAIIQHYGMYPTPLLDVTQSLRVACTFAQEGARDLRREQGFIYVFGLPPTTGAVTASHEHGLQMLRLLSTCPPRGIRPHFQEGFLVGDFPTITPPQDNHFRREDFDFARRLIGKFRVDADDVFWLGKFGPIPVDALFPDSRDPFAKLSEQVVRRLARSGLTKPSVYAFRRPSILERRQGVLWVAPQ